MKSQTPKSVPKRRAKPRVKELLHKASLAEARQNHRKMILIALYENCSNYTWYNQMHGFVRTSDWKRAIRLSDTLTTAVFESAAEHFAANQIASLIRKYPFPETETPYELGPKEQAIETFWLAEQKCSVTNKRFRTLRKRYSTYTQYLEYSRSWIKHIIGGRPRLDEIYKECNFSSGAAIGTHGNATNLYRKLFVNDWSVNPLAETYAKHALCSNEQIRLSFMDERDGYVCYDSSRFHQVYETKHKYTPYNKVAFVPKTAKTFRSIAVEPLLNAYIQNGIDTVLRRKLRKVGIDLSDQSKNQYLAKVGSESGELSTIDLSSASDTISFELVRYLLPYDWFDILNRTRSSQFMLDGQVHRYEKFASMGNGFCFPLETLIFASFVAASLHFSKCYDRRWAVYGDDIIIPTKATTLLRKILNYAGFKVNPQKSFWGGHFRESCGADWYKGQDVRPVYLDYHLDSDIKLMIFHNSTLRSDRTRLFFEGVRSWLLTLVDHERRLVRPESYDVRPRIKDFRSNDLCEKINSNGAFSVPDDIFMCGKYTYYSRDLQRFQWFELVARPVSDTPIDHDGGNWNRSRYLTLLQGSPEGKVNLRRKTRLSIIRR